MSRGVLTPEGTFISEDTDQAVPSDQEVAAMPEKQQKKMTRMTLDERESFQNSSLDEQTFQSVFDINIPEDQLEEFKNKGPIGPWEAAGRNVENAIPFLPFGGFRKFSAWRSINRLKEDKYNGDVTQKIEDVQNVRSLLAELEEERVRGFTVPGQIAAGVVQMPAFLVEFFASGGAATLGKKAVSESIEKVLKRQLTSKVGRVAQITAETAAGAAARTATFGAPRVFGQVGERTAQANLKLTEKGLRISKESAETPFKSVMKAYGDVFIEFFVEDPTGVVGKGFKTIGRTVGKAPLKLPSGLLNSFKKVFEKVKPGKSVRELSTRFGWNNFIEELGEERVGDILRATFNVSDFDAEDPNSVMDRIVSSIPQGEEWLVEAGVLFVTGVGLRGTAEMVDFIQKRRAKVDKQAETKEITEEQADKIAAGEKIEIAETAVEPGVLQQEGPKLPVLPSQDKALVDLNLATVQEKGIKINDKRVRDFLEISQLPQKQIEKIVSEITSEDKTVSSKARDNLADLVLRGRTKRLETEEASLIDKIGQLEQRITEAENQGKPTLRLENSLDSLSTKLAGIQDQLSNLGLSVAPVVGKKEQITVTAQQVEKAINQRVKEVKQLARQETRQEIKTTKQEVKKVQNEILKEINNAKLPAKDKSKFIAQIKNTQTFSQLEKRLPAIQERIKSFQERNTRNKLKTAINKKINRSKPKKAGKKPVGKFKSGEARSAEIQQQLDEIRKASKLTRTDAQKEIDTILGKLDQEQRVANPDELLRLSALDTASGLRVSRQESKQGVEQRPIKDFEELDKRIDTLLREGKDLVVRSALERKSRNEDLIAKAINSIEGNKPGKPTDTLLEKNIQKFRRRLFTGGQSLNGWEDIIDIISQDHPSKAFESPLSKASRVERVENKVKGDTFTSMQDIVNMGLEAYGFKTERQFFSEMKRAGDIQDLGISVDESGKEVRLQLSRADAIKVWMEFQDPELRENIQSENGGYRLGTINIDGFTDEMAESVFRLLNTEDLRFAKSLLKFFGEFYDNVNEQYRKDFGINLPKIENYSPTIGIRVQEDVTDTFLQNINFRKSIVPGATKDRITGFRKIKVQNVMDSVQRHIVEMQHYINWSEKLKDLEAIYNNSEVRRIIEDKFGNKTTFIINDFIKNYRNNGFRNAEAIDSILGKLRVNFTVSVLALKPSIALKQMVSIFSYYEFVNTKEFLSGIKDFADPKKAKEIYDILSKSNLLKTRGGNITRDIQDVGKSKEFAAFQNAPNWKNAMLLFTRLGDRGAIIFGGWSVYKANQRRTKSAQKALEAFERATQATQQSSDLSQLSKWQTQSEFTKLFTMFTSSQNQYMRREMAALRNALADPKKFVKGKGRISRKQFIKTMAIYHFLLPMFFQFVSDFGTWDKNEQLRAAILGSLNGFFIAGDFLDWLVRTGINAFTDDDDEGISVFDIEPVPVSTIARDLTRSIAKVDFDDIEIDEVNEALLELGSDVIGPLTGLPVKRVLDGYEGVEDIIEEDETAKGVLKLMGYSPYLVNKKLDEE